MVLCILFFSAHDSLVRLFPILPYSSIRILLFALLLVVIVFFAPIGNLKAIGFLIFVYIVIGFSYLLSGPLQSEYIFTSFFSPPAASGLWVYFLVFSVIKRPEKWHKRLLCLAYVNIALMAVTALTGWYSSADRSLNYIGLGITTAMWSPIIIQHAFLTTGRKRMFHAMGAVFSVIFVTVYGNRGSLVAILAYVIYCIFKYTKMRRKVLIVAILCAISGVIYFYQSAIIDFVAIQVSKLGIYSRNLTLYLNGNIAYTTHRTDEIWVTVIEAIKSRPVLGYGLCYDRVLNSGTYAHNLVLEVVLSFGIPIGILLLGTHLLVGLKFAFGHTEDDWERLLTPFWVTSTVLLMFNSSLCQLGFFWIPYGILFAYLRARKTSS